MTNFDDLKLHRAGSFSLDGYGCERANLPKRLELVLMPAEVPETESVSRALARVWRLREHVVVAADVVARLVSMLKAVGALDQGAQRMANEIRAAGLRARK